MHVLCASCHTSVPLPDRFDTLELSPMAMRVDGQLLHVCSEMCAQAASARAAASATRDQAQVTRDAARAAVARSRRMTQNRGGRPADA